MDASLEAQLIYLIYKLARGAVINTVAITRWLEVKAQFGKPIHLSRADR
jgi:hypothetical protein